jgi:hypothetical protein
MADLQDDIDRIRAAIFAADFQDMDLRPEAQRYANWCREANDRLFKCQNLLRRGLRTEAIHVAQLEPLLLDLVGTLDFPEREQWGRLAKEYGMDVPPPLQVALATELNQAYAEEAPLQETLRRHRLLAMARAPLRERLPLLWRLAELDPVNPNWFEDIRSYEQARLRELEGDVTAAVRAADVPRLKDLAKELAAPTWNQPVPRELLPRVQTALRRHASQDARQRLADLEPRFTAAVAANDRMGAMTMCQEAVELRDLAALPADSPLLQQIDLAIDWVRQQQERDAQMQGWETACNKLRDKLRRGRGRETLTSLVAQARSFGLGLSDDLEQLLVNHQGRLRRRRLARLASWAAAGVVGLAVLVYFALTVNWRQLVAGAGGAEPKKAAPPEEIAREAVTILNTHCLRCHGDPKKRGGSLDVRSRQIMTADDAEQPEGKKYLVPGRPEDSAVWLRVADNTMPQGDKKLSEGEKNKLKQWIQAGATFP